MVTEIFDQEEISIRDNEYELSIPRKDYILLRNLSEKYNVDLQVILQIIIIEMKAAKIGKKRGIKEELRKIINEYINRR